MKKFVTAVLILFCNSLAYANTATISGTSYSISFSSASLNIQGTIIEFYFTTYDGDRYGFPLSDYDGVYYFSQELKKVGELYKMDYIQAVSGIVDDYGEVSLNLASPDVNKNGVDDVCEMSMSFNGSISGDWYSYDGSSGGLSGSLVRNANSHHGTYSITAHNTDLGDMTISGDFYVGTVSGTVNYSQKEKNVSVNYATTFDTQSSPETLMSIYEIIDEDQIRINAKDIFPSTIFTRNGNNYTAVVVLADGNLGTSWPDYQKWLIVIQDTNDSDGDGVPDLSDSPESKAMPWMPLLLLEN